MPNLNYSTPAPPPLRALDDGVCSNTNNGFLFQIIACAITLAGIVWMTFMSRKLPKRGSIGDYGTPWLVGQFFFGLGFWSTLPSITMFLVFHILAPSSVLFEHAPQMACLQGGMIPCFAMITVFVVPYVYMTKHEYFLGKLGGIINTDGGLATKATAAAGTSCDANAPKILMMGTVSKGLFFIDALRKHRDGHMQAETTLMDFAKDPITRQYVEHNAMFHELVGDSDRLSILEPTTTMINDGANNSTNEVNLGIPLQENTVDKVVVCPEFRQMAPFGDFAIPEKEKAPYMALVFKEAIRVLKPGGTINVYSDGLDALLAEADLKELGCSNVAVEYLHLKTGPYMFGKQHQFHVQWTNRHEEGEEHATAAVEDVYQPHSVVVDELGGGEMAEAVKTNTPSPPLRATIATPLLAHHNNMGANTSSPTSHTPSTWSMTKWRILMGGYQLLMYVTLVAAAAIAFEPLGFPIEFPLYARLSNLPLLIANTYPVMAFVARFFVLHRVGQRLSYFNRAATAAGNCGGAMNMIGRISAFDGGALLASMIFGGTVFCIFYCINHFSLGVSRGTAVEPIILVVAEFYLFVFFTLFKTWQRRNTMKLRGIS